jgi:endonuclease III
MRNEHAKLRQAKQQRKLSAVPSMFGRSPKRRALGASRRSRRARDRALGALLRQVNRRLKEADKNPHGNQDDPLDELVFIILSAQTESYLYRRTFRALKNAYRPWERLLDASDRDVANLIRRGGLANKKTAQLKAAFRQIIADRGRLSLKFLNHFSDEDAFRYLSSLPGVGVKTAKCVMMYSLQRAVFPVDTHVWRIARRLGIAPPTPKPTDAQERDLESLVPESLRFPLHVKFVSLGQDTCHTYFPKCDVCPLSDVCPSSGKTDAVWTRWRQPRGVWANANSELVVNQDSVA